MKVAIKILLLLAFPFLAFASIEDELISAWEQRDTFEVNITKTVVTLADTMVEKGVFAIRSPDALFKTENEFLLYKNKNLYSFVSGSDVGTRTALAQYEFANIAVLVSKLREDFALKYETSTSGFSVEGKKGTGNIVEFKADLDKQFLPAKIIWKDALGYKTEILFGKFKFKNPGNIFVPLKEIEFIEQ
jgi:hypothetical protein